MVESIFPILSVLKTAQVISQPDAPITTWVPNDVVITWTAPDYGGSVITGFTVTIKQKDSILTADTVNCDLTALTLTTCTILVNVLRAAPYSLD